MKILINGSEVDKCLVNVNTGLNYGRFNYEGLMVDRYQVTLSFVEFTDAIEGDYNSIRDEIKMDDALYQETSVFTKVGYGTANDLLQYQQALQEIVTTYLDRILFEKLFSIKGKATFIINSTDEVAIKNDTLVISGQCYRKQ
jgi:hypothetical protein